MSRLGLIVSEWIHSGSTFSSSPCVRKNVSPELKDPIIAHKSMRSQPYRPVTSVVGSRPPVTRHHGGFLSRAGFLASAELISISR